eukprot:maker-scaffold359_size197282-snap-gene-0.23 protein:Tk01275 transcript:maker-scaffold359_size197282-snap-gene-0.23-mRNA-1 annotation:"hypothetical protein"
MLKIFSLAFIALLAGPISAQSSTEATPSNRKCQVCTYGGDMETDQPGRCGSMDDMGTLMECESPDDICFTRISSIRASRYSLKAFRGCVDVTESGALDTDTFEKKCLVNTDDIDIEITTCYCDEEACNNPATSLQIFSVISIVSMGLLTRFLN